MPTQHPSQLRFGLRPPQPDTRIPRFGLHAGGLPPPPPAANWYADVAEWYMLGNDEVGDCFEAAVMHMTYQGACYATPGAAPMPTTADTIEFYSAATGYDPADPNTDQGTFLMGPGSGMETWATRGIRYGGNLVKATAFMQITHPNPVEWQQAIATFGGVIIGLNLPQGIVATDIVPDVWEDASGPSAGGHAIYLCGYVKTPNRTTYQVISWGQLYHVTEDFLLATQTQVVTAVNPTFLNAVGINPAGVDQKILLADMAALRTIG